MTVSSIEDLVSSRGEHPSAHRKRRSRALRAVVAAASALVVLTAGGVVGLYGMSEKYTGQVERIPDPFAGLDPDTRPVEPPAAEGSLDVLLLGSDRRAQVRTTGSDSGAATFVPGAQRTDTIMLVHLNKDRDGGYVVSLPRDSWVAVPGRGLAKVNAAYSWGGPSLMVETVENLTGIRIDHLATVDFAGFAQMTDAVGGVTVNVSEPSYDSANGKRWRAGTHRLDGKEALLYVRQRYGLPRGDFDRVQRQQNLLRALMSKVRDTGMVTRPTRIPRFLDAVTRSVSVDENLSDGDLRALVLSLRGLGTDDVTFLTAPVAGTGREGAQSVVYLDRDRAESLWAAVRGQDVEGFLARQGTDTLGDTSAVR